MIRMPLLVLLASLAAVFVVATSEDLPPTVASHFGAGGVANGYMSREGYTGFMAAMAAGLPLFIGVAGAFLGRLPNGLLNLPNKDYWLAPERRARTMCACARHMTVLACVLVVFLGYVHWLVVEANAAKPPRLDEGRFIAALVVMVASALAWAAAFYFRFRRPANLSKGLR